MLRQQEHPCIHRRYSYQLHYHGLLFPDRLQTEVQEPLDTDEVTSYQPSVLQVLYSELLTADQHQYQCLKIIKQPIQHMINYI